MTAHRVVLPMHGHIQRDLCPTMDWEQRRMRTLRVCVSYHEHRVCAVFGADGLLHLGVLGDLMVRRPRRFFFFFLRCYGWG